MPKHIEIYDTTLRDGTQGEGVSLSLLDKLMIAERLDEFGIDLIEGGYPLSNEKDTEFFMRARDLPFHHKLCAFGMTRRRGQSAAGDPGMEALLAAQTPIVTIVGKTWDFHVTEVLRVALAENIEMIADSLKHIHGAGRRIIYDAEHFFDGFKSNQQYALETLTAAAESGAETVVLCDTNGGSMPGEISEMTLAVVRALRDYTVQVGIHCHNDCELAVANSLAAVESGAVHVQGTINGIGERCGNANLISILPNLAIKRNDFDVLRGGDLSHLTELSRFVYETANMHLRNEQPFVGQSAFAHKGGMHVHAVNRAATSYEHIRPELVGNARRVLVSELSGRSNIMALTTKQKLKNDQALMDRILARVVELENRGYQFEVATASFDLLVQKSAGTFNSHFTTAKYHVDVEHPEHGPDTVVTEATVKVTRTGETCHEVAEGDGPVNALDAALRKALEPAFPSLSEMRLVDYKVRVVNEEAGTAARIRVIVESADKTDTWGTVGVSENIIEASWLALVDAIEFKLHKDESG